MPMSDDRHRAWALRQLQAACDLTRIRSAVDVGAGDAGWRVFCGPWMPECRWTAVEIFEPYSERFLLPNRYSEVLIADIRDLDPLPPADVYFLGDVLEHMPEQDSVQTWNRVRQVAWRIVMGTPVEYTPQGESWGNIHETHLSHWNVGSILDQMPGITAHVRNDWNGCFIADGLRPITDAVRQ